MAVSAQDNRVLLNEDLSYIQGVLRIEVKDVSKLYDTEHQHGTQRLYVALTVQGLMKRTRIVLNESGEASWYQTKLFPLPQGVPLSKANSENVVVVRVLGNSNDPDDVQPDRVIGMVAFHLHDIIKQSPVDGVFDLFSDYQTVGEIKLCLSFSYGLLGYGYSSQLKEDNYSVDHFLKYSLFPRIDPVVGRLDPSKHILVPKATRHPLFIPFNQRVQIGFGQEIAPTLDNIYDPSGKFSLVGQNMNRFKSLQEQLKKESSRVDRLNFLSGLVLDSNKKVEAIKEGAEAAENAKRDVSLTPGFLALSADEMKERGLFVSSLPKEQEKEKEKEKEKAPEQDPSAPSSSVLSSSNSSSSSPHASSSNINTRARSSSLRPTPSLPKDSSLANLSPHHSSHSMGTPLLSSNVNIASPSPASSSTATKMAEGSPANPHIQRLKNL